MKKPLLVALAMIFAISSSGQKIRFSDSTNKWKWFDYTCGGDPYLVWQYIDSFGRDTVVSGYTYKQFVQNGVLYTLMREDTTNKKILVIGGPYGDTSEQVLYDYSLNIGDTFSIPHAKNTVGEIDSVTINSTWHKVWHLYPYSADSGFQYPQEYYVIEGIGCPNGPFFPLSPYTFENCENLTCFNNRGITPLVSPAVDEFDNAISCSQTYGLSVKSIKDKNSTVAVIPNPIDQSSKIIFPDNIVCGIAAIFNDIGQPIETIPFQNKNEILIGDKIKVPGIYYYRVTDNENGKVYSGKFLYR